MNASKGNVRRQHRSPMRQKLCTALMLAMVACTVPAWAQSSDAPQAYSISAGSLADALDQLAAQSKVQIIYPAELVRGKRASAISGQQTWRQALEKLLAGSGLEWNQVNSSTVAIRKAEIAPKPATGKGATRQPQVAAKEEQDVTELEPMVVTGSHIRGVDVSIGSNLITVDRDYIDKSGYSSLADVLKTIPQFGPSQASADYSAGGAVNYAGGEGVDLRGLGLGTTLVLVNGRRQAVSGTRGNFQDITGIPLSAVDRVEILLDGASAIYGSDAIGGVVNVILRKDYSGAQTRLQFGSYGGDASDVVLAQTFGKSWASGNLMLGYQFHRRGAIDAAARDYAADSDKTAFGGNNFSSLNSNPGNIWNLFTGAYAAIPTGQDGTALTPESFSLSAPPNLRNANEDTNLLQPMKQHDAYLNVSQRFGEKVDVFFNGRYSHRPIEGVFSSLSGLLMVPNTNAFYVDPFNSVLPFEYVYYSFADDLKTRLSGAVDTRNIELGTNIALGRWRLSAAGTYSSESMSFQSITLNQAALSAALADPNPATALNVFGDGSNTNPATIAAIQTVLAQRARSLSKSVGFVLDGPLGSLWAGPVNLAVGGDFRRDEMPDTGIAVNRVRDLSREVTSGFAELQVPLIAPENRIAFANSLNLSLAARHERYSDYGTTTNPRIGLTWSPIQALSFRATWGTSFRAPTMTDLDSSVFNPTQYVPIPGWPDPKSPTGTSTIFLLSGIQPGLHEERAKTLTAGFDFKPNGPNGFLASVTYTHIRYTDKIAIPQAGVSGSLALVQEDIWAPIVTRNPTPDQIAAICNDPTYLAPRDACLAQEYGAIIDLRERNLAKVVYEGIDLRLATPISVRSGEMTIGLDGTHQFHNDQTLTPNAPSVSLLDKLNGPLSTRIRAFGTWEVGSADLTAYVNYAPSYHDPGGLPARVGSTGAATTTQKSRIGSWTTFDLSARWRFVNSPRLLNGTELQLSVINLLDKDPPFANTQYGYDAANADPYGRLISLQLIKDW